MSHSVMLLLSIGSLLGTACGQDSQPSFSSASRFEGDNFFPLGVYWPYSYSRSFAKHAGVDEWEYTDQVLGNLKKNHCNFVWVAVLDVSAATRFAQLANKHGIKLAVLPEAVHHPGNTREAAVPHKAAKSAEDTFRTFGQVDGIWGYILEDEPRIASLPYLEAIETELRRLDPSRPLTTVYQRDSAAAAVHRHHFPIVTYDNYPFGHARDPNLPNTPAASRRFYRVVTEALGRQCDKRGTRFWVMPGAFQEIWGNWYWSKEKTIVAEAGAYLHWRMPTVGEMRWQVWESIAAGAKGVVFYTLFPDRNWGRNSPQSPRNPEHERRANHPEAGPKLEHEWDTGQPGALLNIDSTPTRQLVTMGEAYRDVQKLSAVLQTLRFSDIPVIFSSGSFRVQTFRDGHGELYAIVVNDNTDEPVKQSLEVLPGIVAVSDLLHEQDLELVPGAGSGLQNTNVALEAGGGTLLQLNAPVASRPLAKLIEDFSTPSYQASLSRSKVQLSPSSWGVEWKHEVVRSKDGGDEPGTVTFRVHANTRSLNPTGPIYVVYQGGGDVRVAFATDGDGFAKGKDYGFGNPIPIPQNTTEVQFSLLNNDSRLSGFCAIATEGKYTAGSKQR